MKYWILLINKGECSNNIEHSSEINEFLLNIDEFSWQVNNEKFADSQADDKCVLIVRDDNRKIEDRTLSNDEVVDLLESGAYALCDIAKVTNSDNENSLYKIDLKVNTNLFKDYKIIDDSMTEKILGHDYFSDVSTEISEEKYKSIVSFIEINKSAEFLEIEGEESLNPNNESTTNEVYPAEVKIQRDMYSVRELKTDYEDKMLVLAPDFQREFVWNLKQMSELVESILMGIPLPMIYFFEGDEGIIQVVDGKQRLTSLFRYLSNEYPLSKSLSILPHLRGKKYNDLTPAERTKIARYQFVTQTIIPPTPDKIKFDIFERVNRKGATLNNQEMRNALYQGKSTELLEELSKYKSFQDATDHSISPTRMKDRYMILRFLAFYLWQEEKLIDKENNLVEYKSDIDEFLGKTMEFINKSDDTLIGDLKNIFNSTMQVSYKVLGKDVFRIPSKERKRPINMALLESLGYLFSQLVNCSNNSMLKTSVKELINSEEFINALTQKADNTSSVKLRFQKINELIKEIKR